MAIPIIGASRPKQEEASPLPAVDHDLPPPTTAPERKRPLSDEQIRALLAHENPLVRSYAVEQASHLEGEAWSETLRAVVADADPLVASDAIHSLEARKFGGAADAILERFKTGSHELVAVAASALGELAPERLLEAVKQRGRLDDEAYAATATALACIGSGEVVDFLDKALNRQGALTPERRGALYGAALLSGSPELSTRVIRLALEDSKKEEPEGASYPSRGALAAIAGVPLPYSRRAAGLELYDHARADLEATVLPSLAEGEKTALEEALKTKRSGAVLAALEPVLAVPERPLSHGTGVKPDGDGLGTMPKRRRGLLRALIDRREQIDQLEVNAAAVFVAAATQAASVILAGEGNEAASPALATLAKALESPNLDAARLAAMSEDELVALFKERTERMMRRVHGILTHEEMRQPATLRRLARAIVRAGHAEGLFEAAADVDDPRVHEAVLKAIAGIPEAERIVLEALGRTPLEPKLARLALAAAEEIRTERIALAIGRRFTDLRTLARGLLVRAVLRIGDPKLIPLLESRAYRDEPEEVAWAILSVVHGKEKTPKLEDAIARANPHRVMAGDDELRLPLRCKRCGETLGYGFDRALLDVESKDKYGDPAWVGDPTCKACGAEDQLEPTEEAGRILTGHMLEFLAESKRGTLSAPPKVSPAQTEMRGKRMGLAAALRALDKEIQESPSSIRARLHRARLRLVLRRKQIAEDLDNVLALDPRSAEALALRAAVIARAGDQQKAIDVTAEAVRLLAADPPARLYDATDAGAFRASIEDYLVELERGGGQIPADVELAAARARRAAREQEAIAASQAAETRREPVEQQERPSAADEEAAIAAMQKAGRNDPCPCGSGKKFKKCHGKGR